MEPLFKFALYVPNMSQNQTSTWKDREKLQKRKELILQMTILAFLFVVSAFLVNVVSENLDARNIRSGFDFLGNAAGFDIGESLIAFQSADSFLKAFWVGTLNTLQVSVFAIISATLLGFVVGIMQLSKHPIIRALGVWHVEVYRNLPLVVLLLAIYLVVTELLPISRAAFHLGDWFYLSKMGVQFAVPVHSQWLWGGLVVAILGAFGYRKVVRKTVTALSANLGTLVVFFVLVTLSFFLVGLVGGWDIPVATRFSLRGGSQWTPEFLSLWLGLTLYTSAPIAEIVRAGIQAVSQQQWNAGLALGLTHSQCMSYIVVPQALRLALPPLGSQFMNLTKNSSLAVMVGYPDIVSVGNTAINVTAQALEIIALIMLVYLFINLVIAMCIHLGNRYVMRSSQKE